MWVRANLNPRKKNVGDCVIRAIAAATGKSWYAVYDDLCDVGREEADMPSSDHVWGLYLYRLGFEPFLISDQCPPCITVREFCRRYSRGTYIIGTGGHAVCVIDGDFWDTWDSGEESPSFFWRVK